MKRFRFLVGATMMALILGCTPAPAAAPPTAAPKPTVAPAPAAPTVAASAAKPDVAGKQVKLAFTSPPDFGDMYMPLVEERLRGQGVTLEQVHFNGQDPAVKAMLVGEVQMMQLNLNTVAVVNEQGANFRSLMRLAPNEWVLVASSSIKTPADLNGKRVGVHGPNTLTDQLVQATIKQHNLKPNVLVVPGSEARAQALINNQLDASPAEINDLLTLMESKPGQFHVLVQYAKDMPFLTGSTLVARKEFIDQNADLVQTVVDAFVGSMNELNSNPALAKSTAAEYLPDVSPARIDGLLKEYQSIDYWNPALTRDTAVKITDFLVEYQVLKGARPLPETLVDARFLEKSNPAS